MEAMAAKEYIGGTKGTLFASSYLKLTSAKESWLGRGGWIYECVTVGRELNTKRISKHSLSVI